MKFSLLIPALLSAGVVGLLLAERARQTRPVRVGDRVEVSAIKAILPAEPPMPGARGSRPVSTDPSQRVTVQVSAASRDSLSGSLEPEGRRVDFERSDVLRKL